MIRRTHLRTDRRTSGTLATVVSFALLIACGSGVEQLKVQVERQETKVAAAGVSLAKEQARLKVMKDSLEIRVKHNVSIGMSEEQARSIEGTLLTAQKAVTEAEKINLATQRDYLAMLKTRLKALE